MSKAGYETFVTRIGRRHGKRYAERRRLQVPWELAHGNYEALSDLQLREALNDMKSEFARRQRAVIAARTKGWNPSDALRKVS